LEDFRTDWQPDATGPAENEAPHLGRLLFDILQTVLISVVLFAGINLVSARIRVDGYSMYPTFRNGEFVIVNKLAYALGAPQRGDIVVFHFPRDPRQEYIKRVIGLPGDEVAVLDGKVYVNGEPLVEDYIAAAPAYENTWQIPQGELFVLGDNRNNSSDSHSWGTVRLENVVGKAVFVYWPLNELGVIEHASLVSAAPGEAVP
jgi:signal peptidase I